MKRSVKPGILFLLICILVLTTGCIHEEVTYEVNRDGTGSISALFTMSEAYSQENMGSTDNVFGIDDSQLNNLEGLQIKQTPIEETINGEKFIGTKVEVEIPDMESYLLKDGTDTLRVVDLENGNKKLEFVMATGETTEVAITQTPEQQAQTVTAMRAVGAKMTLNIKTDYQVVHTNATIVENGLYTWDLLEMAMNTGGTTPSSCYIEYVPATGESKTLPEVQLTEVQQVIAVSTTSKIMVNGKEVAFDAYNINGNNYFKLRDVALAINGTEKQFGVAWNVEKNAINLTSNNSYKTVGGELIKGDGKNKFGKPTVSPIFMDGNRVELKAYNINGNNYFKLRDLGAGFNIGIGWDATSKTVEIDTTRAYISE